MQVMYIFHSSAMHAMGKLKNPISGKIEKNMDQAQQSIDMMEMLKKKTANNLGPELSKLLDNFLSELKLNFVEAFNKN
jgi:hypothetical protein